MSKVLIDSETLTGLADALRDVTGETRTYTPTEMIEAVTTIMETGTYILVDEEGTEIPAVFVENKTAFTATANDIRIGTTAVTDSGVTVGTKEIPAYHTTEGFKLIPAGSDCIVKIKNHSYTKLQAIFCPFNSSLDKSVAADRVAINGMVYPVSSSAAESEITVDDTLGCVDFGVTNTSGKPYLIRYFTYKEIY